MGRFDERGRMQSDGLRAMGARWRGGGFGGGRRRLRSRRPWLQTLPHPCPCSRYPASLAQSLLLKPSCSNRPSRVDSAGSGARVRAAAGETSAPADAGSQRGDRRRRHHGRGVCRSVERAPRPHPCGSYASAHDAGPCRCAYGGSSSVFPSGGRATACWRVQAQGHAGARPYADGLAAPDQLWQARGASHAVPSGSAGPLAPGPAGSRSRAASVSVACDDRTATTAFSGTRRATCASTARRRTAGSSSTARSLM